jgi:hypothetical protein
VEGKIQESKFIIKSRRYLAKVCDVRCSRLDITIVCAKMNYLKDLSCLTKKGLVEMGGSVGSITITTFTFNNRIICIKGGVGKLNL